MTDRDDKAKAIDTLNQAIAKITGPGDVIAMPVHNDPLSVAFSSDGTAAGVRALASVRFSDATGEWAVYIQAVEPGGASPAPKSNDRSVS